MKNGRHIWVAQAGSSPGFVDEAVPDGRIAEVSRFNYLKRYRTPQIDIDRLKSHPYGTASELQGSAIVAEYQFVVLKPVSRRVRSGCAPQFLFTQFQGGAKSNSQHANRAKLRLVISSQRSLTLGTTSAHASLLL